LWPVATRHVGIVLSGRLGITFSDEGELAPELVGALEHEAAGLPTAALELGQQ
jgi:hypothetical protein